MEYGFIPSPGVGIYFSDCLPGVYNVAGFHIYLTDVAVNGQIVAMPDDKVSLTIYFLSFFN
jgi:hypothetical protein